MMTEIKTSIRSNEENLIKRYVLEHFRDDGHILFDLSLTNNKQNVIYPTLQNVYHIYYVMHFKSAIIKNQFISFPIPFVIDYCYVRLHSVQIPLQFVT